MDAILTEFQNWGDMKMYEEVEDQYQEVISTRWVVTDKPCPDSEKGTRARLIACGFEDQEQVSSDPPKVAKCTLKAVQAIIAKEGCTIPVINIKAAFLKSRDIKKEIYL